MNANRETDEIVLRLSPQEAHVLVWGGPPELFEGLNGMLRTTLADVEDRLFSNREYHANFDDLPAMYGKLELDLAAWRKAQE